MKLTCPTALVILDGFGYKKDSTGNAIAYAKTPNLTTWFAHYPHTTLRASGTAVGLPDGYIGNSEVGHLTIGCGRVIQQPVTQINNAIDDGSLFTLSHLIDNLQRLRASGGSLHIMGLLSDAGVHAHTKHLYAYLRAAHQQGISAVFVHAFLDGRDAPPQSAAHYLTELDELLQKEDLGSIASIHGRFYAMDRDNNLERTAQSYNVMTQQTAQATPRTWQQILNENYARGIFDEFIPPTLLNPDATVHAGDGILFINFRADRARQLTNYFVDYTSDKRTIPLIPLSFFITPTDYLQHSTTQPVTILFKQPILKNCLMEELNNANLSLFSCAETEKYAHITYFFNGRHEAPWPHETRFMIPSLHTRNYVNNPEMSADRITAAVLQSLRNNPQNFYLINYANADMVGHSGNFSATIKAIEFLDAQLKILYDEIVERQQGTLYITADHGNAETMWYNNPNEPCTEHTTNPVPFIMIKRNVIKPDLQLPLQELADIAPFILSQLTLGIPNAMRHQR